MFLKVKYNTKATGVLKKVVKYKYEKEDKLLKVAFSNGEIDAYPGVVSVSEIDMNF